LQPCSRLRQLSSQKVAGTKGGQPFPSAGASTANATLDADDRFAAPLPSAAQDLSPVPKLGGNEYLRLASTFHSLHAISKQVRTISGSYHQRLLALATARRAAPLRFACPPSGIP
jgi:hypothetical protein